MTTDFSSKEISELYSEGVIAEKLSLKPVNLELVGDVSGKVLVDLGCGDGRYSILFAEKGATVMAFDLSPHQIEIAKKKNPHSLIEYKIADVSELNFPPDSADIVFLNLVIPDIDDERKLEKVISQVARIMKKDGRFIFSMLHPLYLSPEQDDLDKPKNFNKEKYFQEGHIYQAEAITEKGRKIEFSETHFTLNFISQVLNKNGLVIRRLRESGPVPEKEIFLPKYLVFECVLF